MHKTACILALIALFLIPYTSFADDDGTKPVQPGRPRVAVLPFDSNGTMMYDLSDALCEQFSTALVNCGRFDVFERRQVEKVLSEQGIGASGVVDPATAVQIGKMVGCQLIGCGTIIDTKCEYQCIEYKGKQFYLTKAQVTINYKLLDTETGQIWKQNSITDSTARPGRADYESTVRSIALGTVNSFVKTLYPVVVGQVIRVDDDKIIIDLGSSQGICSSSEFEIISKGNEIINPATGEILGYEQKPSIIAKPLKDSIQSKMCYVAPGHWKEVNKFLTKKWEWRLDTSKLKDIKVGDEVRTVVPQH